MVVNYFISNKTLKLDMMQNLKTPSTSSKRYIRENISYLIFDIMGSNGTSLLSYSVTSSLSSSLSPPLNSFSSPWGSSRIFDKLKD